MKHAHYLLCAAALFAACSPAAQKASPEPVPEAAAPELVAAFPDCQWGEVTSSGIAIWSFACANDRLVADPALPGFQRETRDEQGQILRHPVVRIFTKPPEALLDAALDQVRAASPGGEACTLEPGRNGDYVFMPAGEALEAYGRFTRGEADGPSNPCGPLGPQEAGGSVFRVLEGAPDKVVMINFPSDIAIFDADTLRAVPPAP